jgi:hypothetical protein
MADHEKKNGTTGVGQTSVTYYLNDPYEGR